MLWHSWHIEVSYSTVYTLGWPSTAVTVCLGTHLQIKQEVSDFNMMTSLLHSRLCCPSTWQSGECSSTGSLGHRHSLRLSSLLSSELASRSQHWDLIQLHASSVLLVDRGFCAVVGLPHLSAAQFLGLILHRATSLSRPAWTRVYSNIHNSPLNRSDLLFLTVCLFKVVFSQLLLVRPFSCLFTGSCLAITLDDRWERNDSD